MPTKVLRHMINEIRRRSGSKVPLSGVCGGNTQFLAQSLAGPQQSHADSRGTNARGMRKLLGSVALQRSLQQSAIPLRARVEHSPQINGTGIESVGRLLNVFERHRRGGTKARAVQISGDGIHPIAHQTGISQLLAIFPAARPGSLGDLFSFFERRAARDEKAAGGTKSVLKGFSVSGCLHRRLTVQFACQRLVLVFQYLRSANRRMAMVKLTEP
jgi:hypothetical protein